MISTRKSGTPASAWRFIKPDHRITAATLLFCVLTVIAGNWQRGRAEYKEALQARFDERSAAAPATLSAEMVVAAEYDRRSVRVRGSYTPEWEILLDNKVHGGRAGYQALTPLRISGSATYVLVNRGWVAQGRTRADLPQTPTPEGAQEVAGVAIVPGTAYMELRSDGEAGRVWQNLDLEKYRQWSGLLLQPVVIEQTNETGDGLARDWPRPDFGIEKHRIYALQWYTFCALAIVLYGFFHIRRGRPQD